MKVGAIVIGAPVVLFALLLAWQSLDPIAQERREWQLRQEQLRAAQAAERTEALEPLRRTLTGFGEVLLVAGLGSGIIVLSYMVVNSWRDRRTVIYPDRSGALPVPRRDIESGALNELSTELMLLRRQIEALAASRQPVPVNFAPHITYSPEWEMHVPRSAPSPIDTPDVASEMPTVVAPALVPTFAELLQMGALGFGRPFIFGYAQGQPVTGSLKQIYSCGIGGGQGSGKTTIALYLAAQTALHHGELVVIDPHGDSPSSFGQRIAPLERVINGRVAVQPSAILDRLNYVWRIYKSRQERGVEHEHPVLLIVDEWTALLRRGLATKLPAYLAELAIEGRKYCVYFVLCAHKWDVESAGGSDVRNMLSTHYAARNRAEEVRMQTGLRTSDLPTHPLQLEPGRAIFVPSSGAPAALSIPQILEGDIVRVGASVSSPPRAGEHHPLGNGPADGPHARDRSDGTVRSTGDAQARPPHFHMHDDARTAGTTQHNDVPDVPQPSNVPVAEYATEEEPTSPGARSLPPEAIRALHTGGWSKTKIAELLQGTKAKRLAIVESALQEVDDSVASV